MTRLTIRNSDGSVSQPTHTTSEKAMYKLAEYEDLGRTPEELKAMLEPTTRNEKMLRLVTDTPETNVSNALNMFYIKDRRTFVRGYGEGGDDIDLIDFVKRIAKRQRIPMQRKDAYEVAEYLTDVMFDCDPESKEGLLGLFFTAAWAFAEIRERLKEYEDTGLEPERILGMMATIAKETE